MGMSQLNAMQNEALNTADVIPLYESENHSIYWTGCREESEAIPCNSYLLIDEGEGYLFEPGGLSQFQATFDKVSEKISLFDLNYILLSHQDPDVCASLPSWLQFNPDMEIICPALWERFLPHYLVYHTSFRCMGDTGLNIALKSGGQLQCISAPYLHSPGNMVVFDSISGYLFSGDIGAAVGKDDTFRLLIDDWQSHINDMIGFHQRYMGSTRAAAAFVEKVQSLPLTAMLPQHGQLFRGAEVQQFLDWFEVLPCGVDHLHSK